MTTTSRPLSLSTQSPRLIQKRPSSVLQLTPDNENICMLRTCTQVVSARHLNYQKALSIIANEDYLKVLNLAARKRSPRTADPLLDLETISRNVSSLYSSNELAKVGLVGILTGIAFLNLQSSDTISLEATTQTSPLKLQQRPKPLNGLVSKTAKSLVPRGSEAVQVFPPYHQTRSFPAISVIFRQKRRCKRRRCRKKKKLFGLRASVKIVDKQPCILNVSCTEESNLSSSSSAFDDGLTIDGPPSCHLEVDSQNSCLRQRQRSLMYF